MASTPKGFDPASESTTEVCHQEKVIFHFKTGGYNQNQDALHQMPRHQQTTIFRLKTGVCRLNGLLKRIGVKTSAQMPLWRGGPNTRTLPAVLRTLPPSKAADMTHLCVSQNQVLGVCRGFVHDIQVCGTHRREDLVNATFISNAEEEEFTEYTSHYAHLAGRSHWRQCRQCHFLSVIRGSTQSLLPLLFTKYHHTDQSGNLKQL